MAYWIGPLRPTNTTMVMKKSEFMKQKGTFDVLVDKEAIKMAKEAIKYREAGIIDEAFEKDWIQRGIKLSLTYREQLADRQQSWRELIEKSQYDIGALELARNSEEPNFTSMDLNPPMLTIIDRVFRSKIWDNGNVLVGEPVRRGYYERNGVFHGENTVSFITGFSGNMLTLLNDTGSYSAYPNQIEFISETMFLRPKSLDDVYQQRYKTLCESVDKEGITRLEKERLNAERMVADGEKMTQEGSAIVKSIKTQLEKLKKTPINIHKDIIEAMEQMRKHKKVESVSFSNGMTIRVDTLPISPTDPDTGKPGKMKLGSFVIIINPFWKGSSSLENYLNIYNKDYETEGYPHPNVRFNHSVCWGNQAEPLLGIAKRRDLASALYLAIEFLSVYPHPDGNPYIGYDHWKDAKRKSTTGMDNCPQPINIL